MADNLPWYAGISKRSDLPLMKQNTMMNSGDSLSMFICHICVTKDKGLESRITPRKKGYYEQGFQNLLPFFVRVKRSVGACLCMLHNGMSWWILTSVVQLTAKN